MNFLVCDLSLLDRPHLIGTIDRFISYEDPERNANWDSPIHAPISWHGYAAAMSGRYVCAPIDDWVEHIKWCDMALVLWNYSPKMAERVIRLMKENHKKVIGAFHENGDTFQNHARSVNWLIEFKNCANACHAILTYPRDLVYKDIYKSMGITSELLYIPQPYYTHKRYEYIIEQEKRKGIFIAPKRKDKEMERRNWIYNIIIAVSIVNKEVGSIKKVFNRITTINDSSISNERLENQLQALYIGYNINVVSSLEYHDYLKLIASHQLTINLDSSDTQGQVDADSMFVNVPLFQPENINYKTDFGDLYYKLKNNGLKDYEATEVIMGEISTFENVRKIITKWYQKT